MIHSDQAFDPHLPRHRVRPPANWINDPNGPFHWRGLHHLFYQHNPDAPRHTNMHWGHVSSADLVHWEHHPIALTPTPGGPDEAGCWSGCVVDDDGVPTAVYTGIDRSHTGVGTICLAHARPDDALLTSWTPLPRPVVTGPPAGLDVVMFRDPFVFRHEGRRWALVGAGHADGTPSVLLYDCEDLSAWRFAGVLLDGHDPTAAGILGQKAVGWECPQLLRAGGEWVLVLSLWDGDPLSTAYLTGDLRSDSEGGLAFAPRTGGRLDHGRDFYAPSVFQDTREDRTLMWGWSWEARPQDEVDRGGWAGVLTAPRVLDIRPDGTLSIAPAPELTLLRAAEPLATGPDPIPLPDAYDLHVTAHAPTTVSLLRAASGARVTVRLDPTAGTVTLDRSAWPRTPAEGTGPVTAPTGVSGSPALDVRILMDGSLLEIFAADRATVTERLYRRPDDLPELMVEGAEAQVTGWVLVPRTHG